MKVIYVSLIFCLLLGGCRKKFINTATVCNGKFFVEIFDINVFGVYSHYLTDSTSFRIFIGKYDVEHEGFTYRCSGDSLIVARLEKIDTTGILKPVESTVFSIVKLKSEGKFE